MESLEFFRRAERLSGVRQAGYTTLSPLYALQPPPPHLEQSILELPIYTPSQKPLQDTDGVPFAIADYHKADGNSKAGA